MQASLIAGLWYGPAECRGQQHNPGEGEALEEMPTQVAAEESAHRGTRLLHYGQVLQRASVWLTTSDAGG